VGAINIKYRLWLAWRWIKRNPWKLIFFIIFIGFIFFLAYLSAIYDIKKHGNWIAVLSGFWSAAATVFLGGIAIWQSRVYKKENDRLLDTLYMPEIYKIPDTVYIGSVPRVQAPVLRIQPNSEDAIQTIDIDCGCFCAIKPPIFNIEPYGSLSISNVSALKSEEAREKYKDKKVFCVPMKIKPTVKKISLFTNSDDVFFKIHLSIQKMWDDDAEYDCLLKLCFYNISNTQYIQDLSFRFSSDGTLKNYSAERAQRFSTYSGVD
jgi:hypothetical protein